MKKLLLILFAIILMAGKCNDDTIIPAPLPTDNPAYVFEKLYEEKDKDQSIKDLYYYVKHYDLDSIPLGEWLSVVTVNDDYNIVQYISTGNLDTMNLLFNYNIYMRKNARLYQVKIRKIEK